MIRFITLALLSILIATPVHAQEKSFINVEEVTSDNGVTAWLVRDETVPVIAVSLLFKGGAAFDAPNKAGLANLASTLMDEGAGDKTAQDFQKTLKDNAIQFSFSSGRDGFYGQLKTVTKNKDVAFDLLKLSLTQPRFDQDAIDRMRASILTSLRYDEQNAGWHAQKALLETLYDGHPYARQIKGTAATLKSITRDDLMTYHRQTMTRDNVIIGVAGDINAIQLKAMLDDVFGDLPETGTRPTIAMANLNLTPDIIQTQWSGAQSVVMMAQKGIARTDDNWFTAQLLNYTLGGGGFASRLMEEVRVKRGLTYGISTGIIDYLYGPLMLGQASVSPDNIDQTITVIKDQWKQMAQQGVTKKELADAKSYLIGSLPLSLSSTNAIASIIVQMQEDNLPMNYLDLRARDINSVTLEKINQFAKIWLASDNLTIAVAGPLKDKE